MKETVIVAGVGSLLILLIGRNSLSDNAAMFFLTILSLSFWIGLFLLYRYKNPKQTKKEEKKPAPKRHHTDYVSFREWQYHTYGEFYSDNRHTEGEYRRQEFAKWLDENGKIERLDKRDLYY